MGMVDGPCMTRTWKAWWRSVLPGCLFTCDVNRPAKLTTPGVEPGLSRPRRDVLTTRRCGRMISIREMSCRSWIIDRERKQEIRRPTLGDGRHDGRHNGRHKWQQADRAWPASEHIHHVSKLALGARSVRVCAPLRILIFLYPSPLRMDWRPL